MIDLGVGLDALLGEIEAEENMNDPDVLADPIFQTDLREQLLGMMQSVAGDDVGQQTLLPALNKHEHDILSRAITQQQQQQQQS